MEGVRNPRADLVSILRQRWLAGLEGDLCTWHPAQWAAIDAYEREPELLRRIEQLEAENRRLRKVVEAKGITYNDALIIGRHLEEMEKREDE